MSETLQHMGSMYRKRGLDTEAQLIGSRIAAAQAAYRELGTAELPALLRTALGFATTGDLQGLVDKVKEADVTFEPSAGRPEMVLMATAILRQAIDDGDNLGDLAALGTVVVAFGGLRTFEADADLVNYAQQALARRQDVGPPIVSTIKYSKRPSLEGDQASLLTYAEQNNLSAAHVPLKNILDSAPAYTESAYRSLSQQFNTLASAHNRLAEQMNAHWWVLNGWSLDVGCSFRELSAPDAGVRMGTELARLTKHSSLGLFAALALLSRVLTQAEFDPKQRVTVGEAACGSSIEWRRTLASSLPISTGSALLFPVSLAIATAIDANDERDWEPRYERACGISPGASVELLGLAYQVYLESMLRSHISV